MGERTLLDTLPQRGTPAERCAAWLALNPGVWDLFVEFACKAKDRGQTRFSVDAILHAIRWHVVIETEGDDFRLNNDFAAPMARRLIAERPEFAGFFELRRSQDDAAV